MALVPRDEGFSFVSLNVASGSWEAVSQYHLASSVPYHVPQLVVVQSQLFGSLSSEGQVKVYKADGQWEALPKMALPSRCYFGLCAMGNGMAAVGGFDLHTDQPLRTAEHFSHSEGRWNRLPDMRQARGGAGAAMWEGKLVVVGGHDGVADGVERSVEAYDPGTGQWQAMPSLLHARVFACVVVVEGCLMVIGGSGGPGRKVGAVERYDAEARTWRVVYNVEEGGGSAVILPRECPVGTWDAVRTKDARKP